MKARIFVFRRDTSSAEIDVEQFLSEHAEAWNEWVKRAEEDGFEPDEYEKKDFILETVYGLGFDSLFVEPWITEDETVEVDFDTN